MTHASVNKVIYKWPNDSVAEKEQTYIFVIFLTHPRHYAENGLRLLEEGDRVEGSSGFPGSVCLHPLHGPPPLCTASSLCGPPLLLSPLLVQRHRVCGAPGNRKSLNLLLLLLSPLFFILYLFIFFVRAAARMDARVSLAPWRLGLPCSL